MKRRRMGSFEQLETRLCLTVAVDVDEGDLIVSGDADGAVEIIAVDETTFQVTDAGGAPVTVEGITDDIRIELDAGDAAANDQVTLDLAGQAVDRVVVELGRGDNSFLLKGGTVGGSLKYRGGDGDDLLEIATDAVVQKSVYARLGDGENSVVLDGKVERSLTVRGGADDDEIHLGEDARIERNLSACLGDGDNDVTLAGEVGRRLTVRAGAGDDTVEILATALVERSVLVSLGDGDNLFVDAGAVEEMLSYHGLDGNDTVEISEDATVDGNVCIRLGDGENSVSHAGNIEGDLRITSANEEDVVELDEGNVGGETEVSLGEEFELGRPGGCFPRGRFGHGFGGRFGGGLGRGLGGGFGGFRSLGHRGFWR